MKKLNPTACRILDRLTQGLTRPGHHRKIDNAPGFFMAAHVERIGECRQGPLFSVAHYYEQNGDLMKDPDMVFIRGQDGDYYPIEFQQDNIGFYGCAVKFDEHGEITHYHPAEQAEMAGFANHWMLNLLIQQQLKLEQDPASMAEEIQAL